MKIAVVLENSAGELDRSEFEANEDREDFEEVVDDAITQILEGWIFSVGDTVKIVEVQS